MGQYQTARWRCKRKLETLVSRTFCFRQRRNPRVGWPTPIRLSKRVSSSTQNVPPCCRSRQSKRHARDGQERVGLARCALDPPRSGEGRNRDSHFQCCGRNPSIGTLASGVSRRVERSAPLDFKIVILFKSLILTRASVGGRAQATTTRGNNCARFQAVSGQAQQFGPSVLGTVGQQSM